MSKLRVEIKSFSPPTFIRSATSRIKDYFNKSGADGLIMGIDGGVNSSVAALLCSRALTGSKVHAIYLMERGIHSKRDLRDVNRVVQVGKFRFSTVEVTRLYRTMLKELPPIARRRMKDMDKLKVAGNMLDRLRMSILYYYANENNYLVCGTKDKSDWLMGYFTKWGDGGADLLPIASIYRTQVKMVARSLKTGFLASKPPSQKQFKGQRAEKELPAPYDELDAVLLGIEKGWSDEEIVEDTKIGLDIIEKTREMVEYNWHKRHGAIIL